MNNSLTGIAATLLLTSVASQAAVLAATNFDSTTKSNSSQDMTNIVWAGDDPVAVAADTTISTVASNNAGYFTNAFYGATAFAPDQNIENEGPWAATVLLTVDAGSTVSLTGITFDYRWLNNSGLAQGLNHPSKFDITVNGNTYDSTQFTGNVVSGSISFNATEALTTGINTIVITASEVGGPGNNIGIDNLTFNGDITAVPEPSSALLAIFGLFCLHRKRAQRQAPR